MRDRDQGIRLGVRGDAVFLTHVQVNRHDIWSCQGLLAEYGTVSKKWAFCAPVTQTVLNDNPASLRCAGMIH